MELEAKGGLRPLTPDEAVGIFRQWVADNGDAEHATFSVEVRYDPERGHPVWRFYNDGALRFAPQTAEEREEEA